MGQSIFSGVRDADASKTGVYFEPDNEWVVLVNSFTQNFTRQKIPNCIVDCKILETTCATARPGTTRSCYIDMTKDAAPGNIKNFVEAAHESMTGEALRLKQLTQKDSDAYCDNAVSEKQPFAGVILRLSTKGVLTRAGNPFTVHEWAPVAQKDLPRYEDLAASVGLSSAAKK